MIIEKRSHFRYVSQFGSGFTRKRYHWIGTERWIGTEMAPWIELPYEFENCTSEEDKLIRKCLIGYRHFVKCGKRKYVMPAAFQKHAEAIYNLDVRPNDVWVITFPRSGTTWTQELVWLLENDLDYITAKEKPLYERFPMLELTSMIPEYAFELIKMNFLNLGKFQGLGEAARQPSWQSLRESTSPRFIKTHLPLSLLPPNLLETAKVVYVARDPRDVVVSFFYLQKMVAKSLFRSNFSHYWEAFRRDLLPWTPIISHTNEAWMQRDHPNMHFVFYEDMLKDLPKEVKRMAKFLKRDYSEESLLRLSQYISFDSLKKNKSVNNTTSEGKDAIQFIRKGEAGGWKGHFDAKMELQAEEFIIERMKGMTLTYPSFRLHETTHL